MLMESFREGGHGLVERGMFVFFPLSFILSLSLLEDISFHMIKMCATILAKPRLHRTLSVTYPPHLARPLGAHNT